MFPGMLPLRAGSGGDLHPFPLMWFLKSGAGRRPGRDEDECPSAAFGWNCLGWVTSDKVPYFVDKDVWSMRWQRWWFFLMFHLYMWKWSNLTDICKIGWLKPPTREAGKPELWSVRCLFCWKQRKWVSFLLKASCWMVKILKSSRFGREWFLFKGCTLTVGRAWIPRKCLRF